MNVTNNGSGVYNCPFCDSKIYFNDGTERKEVNITNRIIKEDKTENLNLKLKYEYSDNMLAVIIVIVLLFIAFSLISTL